MPTHAERQIRGSKRLGAQLMRLSYVTGHAPAMWVVGEHFAAGRMAPQSWVYQAIGEFSVCLRAKGVSSDFVRTCEGAIDALCECSRRSAVADDRKASSGD